MVAKTEFTNNSVNHTIDFVIVNKVSNSGVLDLSIADHKMIFVTIEIKIKTPGLSNKRVRNYRRFKQKCFQKDPQDEPYACRVTSLFDNKDDITHA